MSKSKKKYSNKAKDNLGLAFKYAKTLADRFGHEGKLEDSEFYSNALMGLVAAEKNYKSDKINPITGKPYKFSTYAYRCMMTHCTKKGTLKEKNEPLDNVIPLTKKQAKDNMLEKLTIDNKSNGDEEYEAKLMLTTLKRKINGYKDSPLINKKSLKLDFQMLLRHYVEEKTLEEVGKEFKVSKERVRQRVERIKQFIAYNIRYAELKKPVESRIVEYKRGKLKTCNSKKFTTPIEI